MLARIQGLREAAADCALIERPHGASPFLIICEHASRRLPSGFEDLGLNDEALSAHIAWDPGALDLARSLSERLDATLIHQNYSRLIYDCNRPPDSPAAMPEKSEIFVIPGNHGLSVEERRERTDALYVPFHAAIGREIALRKAQRRNTLVVTMHTFTPVYHGKPRAVEIGILHDRDSRLADLLLAKAETAEAAFKVRRNEPYGPADGVTHSLVLHGIAQNLHNVMIEVRNDLVKDEAGQRVVAGFLAELLAQSVDA